MMNVLLAMALGGSAVTLLWLALRPLTAHRFSPRWHAGVLKLALALFLLPLGPVLTAARRWVTRAAAPAVYSGAAAAAPSVSAGMGPVIEAVPELTAPVQAAGAGGALVTLPAEGLALLTLLWGVGAVALLVYKGLSYWRFRRRVLAVSTVDLTPATAALTARCAREVGYGGRVSVRVAPLVGAPFAMGLLRPVVVLPAQGPNGEELRYVLLHELTHIKRGDLWVRALCVAAQALHWYVPPVYLLTRALQDVTEQVCDAGATGALSRWERYEYGKVLLRAAVAQRVGEWAVPLSAKGTVKGRLARLFEGKPMTGRQRVAAALVASLLLGCGTATLTACSGLVGATPAVTLGETPAPEETQPIPPEEHIPAPDEPVTAAPVEPAVPIFNEGAEAPPPAEAPVPEPEPVAVLAAPTQTEIAPAPEESTPTPALPEERSDTAYEAALAEVAEMDIPGQIAAAGLTYPYPTLTQLLTIPAVSAWRREEPSELMAAQGTQGEEGYVRQSDFLEEGVNTQTERLACARVMKALPNGYLIPLYDNEGEPLGWFLVQGGRSVS